jgi:hypothetical protein
MTITEQLKAAKHAQMIAAKEVDRIQAIIDADDARAISRRSLYAARATVVDVERGLIRFHNDPTLAFVSRDQVPLVAANLNDTFERIAYAMDNPDAALRFADDGTPRLIATDYSGIDHETLFKLGREARL